MALTVRGDGTGSAFLVQSAWWNDYHDLLTGAMTDQSVFLKYTPGGSTGLPTLKVQAGTNSSNAVEVLDNSGTLQFKIDKTGIPKDGSGNSYAVMKGSGATAGRQIFVGTATPTGANEGDIWIKA